MRSRWLVGRLVNAAVKVFEKAAAGGCDETLGATVDSHGVPECADVAACVTFAASELLCGLDHCPALGQVSQYRQVTPGERLGCRSLY